MDPITAISLVLKGLDILAAALVTIPELKARYDAYRSKVQTFIDEKRPPTDAEFAELIAEGDDLSAAIAAAAAAKVA